MTPLVSVPLQLSELQARYGLKTPGAVRARCDGLGIVPTKQGRSRWVSPADVALLDELHEHIKEGGTVASFLQRRGMAIATVEPTTDSDADTVGEASTELALSAPTAEPVPVDLLLNAIAAVAQSRPSSPIERYRFLDEAVAAGWQVTTADLRWATGQSTIKVGQWRDYSFERVGRGLFRVIRGDSR